MVSKVSLCVFVLIFMSMLCFGWYKNLTGDDEPELVDRVDLHTEQIQSLFDEIEDLKFRVRILEKENL